MLKKLIALGAIFMACASCTSSAPGKTTVAELYNAPNGNYKVRARCLSSNANKATITDKTGSEVVRTDVKCFGQYGEGTIAIQGNEKRMFKFRMINEVLGEYKLIRIRKTVGGDLAIIDVDGQEVTVELIKNGRSNKVVKTTNGFIRL